MKRLPQGSGTLLVADDDAGVRLLATRILKLGGYKPLVAKDFSSALETFREHDEIRLVLLDLNMPGGTCAQAVLNLRQIRPEVPILVMAGHPESETRARLGDAQVDGLLEKPFQPPELIAWIRQALGEDE